MNDQPPSMVPWAAFGNLGSRVALASVATLMFGCGSAESPRSPDAFRGTVRDSAGVQIVENTREGIWRDVDWAVEEILTIGQAAGDADYQFGRIAGIDAMSDGRIAVLDQQAQRVQIYGPNGTYLRSIGHPGSGPGEFSPQTLALFVGRGDTIVVPDIGNQRVHLIPPSGEPTSFPLRTEEGVAMGFAMTEGGVLVSQRRAMNVSDPRLRTAAKDVVLAQTYDGMVTDTLLMPDRAESFELGESGPRFKLLAPESRWTLLDGGRIALATTDAFRINIYGVSGQLERIVKLPYEVRPVGDSDRRTAFALLRLSMKNRGASPESIERMLRNVSFADAMPVLALLRGGPHGTLWVQQPLELSDLSEDDLEHGETELEQGGAAWSVFDAEGRYGGLVEFADRFTPLIFRADRVYGVYRDEFDAQYVQVYRLKLPEPGDR